MTDRIAKKLVLAVIGVAGGTIFWAFFAITFATPEWVEDFAQDYIERKAAERIDEAIDSLELPESDSALINLAQTMYERNTDRMEELREDLRNEVHERRADAIARIRDLDCECRDRIARQLEEGLENRIVLADAANDRLVDFIHYKYVEVVDELKRDIRVFTASNGMACLLLLLISLLKPRAIDHLFLPGVLLAVSLVVCTNMYIFQQDWLLIIINGDYMGFAYLIWLGTIFVFLCDVVLNRGRITGWLLNAFFNAIGSAASVSPC